MAIRYVENDREAPRNGLYIAGLLIGLVYLIAAELIWVPAPIVTGGGMEWIEWIDYLFFGLAIVPLCWCAGALYRYRMDKRTMRPSRVLKLFRGVIAAANLATAILIAAAPDKLELGIGGVVICAILMFGDLIAGDVLYRRRFPWRSVTWLAGTAAALVLLVWPTSYNVTYPGMTLNLNRYAAIEGGMAGGVIDGVLVFDRPAVLADRLYGALFPQYQFQPIPENEPPLSETYAQVVAMKQDANKVASAIAMEKAGIGKGAVPDGVRIVAIVKDSPADGHLQAGDIIDALDGERIYKVDELIAKMESEIQAGDVVIVSLRRGNEEVETTVTAAASADNPGRAVFGISIQPEVKLDTPRLVTYNNYMAHVGGPSHGAMLTLALIDQLTPGDMTKGLHIAGTGTIEADGSVGMVGGIPQKAYAVSRTKADVFFVPLAGEEAARAAAPDLTVVPVNHINDVLDWLSNQNNRSNNQA
ncbi:PDZ domain-containing protein [Paenibacillus sp. strain BS8-2]